MYFYSCTVELPYLPHTELSKSGKGKSRLNSRWTRTSFSRLITILLFLTIKILFLGTASAISTSSYTPVLRSESIRCSTVNGTTTYADFITPTSQGQRCAQPYFFFFEKIYCVHDFIFTILFAMDDWNRVFMNLTHVKTDDYKLTMASHLSNKTDFPVHLSTTYWFKVFATIWPLSSLDTLYSIQ